MKLKRYLPRGIRGVGVLRFFYFSSGGHLVNWSGTIQTILVEGNFIAGRPKAALPFWLFMVVLLSALWPPV